MRSRSILKLTLSPKLALQYYRFSNEGAAWRGTLSMFSLFFVSDFLEIAVNFKQYDK